MSKVGTVSPAQDKELEFTSSSGAPGRFRARIFETPSGTVALLTDIEFGDAKPSLTNNIERAVASACRRFELRPGEVGFIEHYDNRGEGFPREHMFRDRGESFDVVTFAETSSGNAILFRQPSWKRVSKAQVEQMLGGALP